MEPIMLTGVINSKIKTYQQITPNTANCISRCKGMKGQPIVNIIDVAANAIGDDGKMDRHQCRVGKILLGDFAEKLKQNTSAIMGCKAFEKLLNEVEKAKIPGIGELAIYDTAHRISVALGIPLDGIYMHAGTKRGAKKLFGSSQIKGKKRLEKTDFPSSFNGFTEEEIENMLCISFGH